MSDAAPIRRMAAEYIGRLAAVASRNGDGFSNLIASASFDQALDLFCASCVACCRLESNTQFVDAVTAEADRVESIASTATTEAANVLLVAANRLRSIAGEAKASGRGRPLGAFSTSAGAKLQAVGDAHAAMGRDAELALLLERGIPPDECCGRAGERSPGASALISALVADDPTVKAPTLAKAMKNLRARKDKYN